MGIYSFTAKPDMNFSNSDCHYNCIIKLNVQTTIQRVSTVDFQGFKVHVNELLQIYALNYLKQMKTYAYKKQIRSNSTIHINFYHGNDV